VKDLARSSARLDDKLRRFHETFVWPETCLIRKEVWDRRVPRTY